LSKSRAKLDVIIHRALYRETTKIWAAIIVMLMALFTLILFGQMLSRAARGEFAQGLVLALLGLQLLHYLDVLLPLGLYLALLLTLGRWYRDSEMVVLAACGIGLPQLFKPVLILAGAGVALTATLSLVVNPWTSQLSEQLKQEGRKRSELTLIVPGVFSESKMSGRIFYAEAISDDGVLQNVFVTNPRSSGSGLIVARSGRPTTPTASGAQVVELRDGAIYEGDPGITAFRMGKFEVLHLRIEPQRLAEGPRPVSAWSFPELLRSNLPQAKAEWHWRLARPVSVTIFVLFAVVFAYTDPRRGRAITLIAAIVVYFVYTNLLGFGLALLRNGKVPMALGLWWVHAAAAGVAAYLLWRRLGNRPLFALPRLRR
jgi:lipopolysaccharide export system permease protein